MGPLIFPAMGLGMLAGKHGVGPGNSTWGINDLERAWGFPNKH
jgi:hypothetical protein